MTPEVRDRIEQIRHGNVPKGYKKTKTDIVPDEWEEHSIGRFICEYTEKTTEPNQYPVLTSARAGLMLQTDYYTNRQVTTEDNVGYNVLPYGYITFRSRSDDGHFRFNENRLIEHGIISYFYPVFSFSEEVCHGYMLQLLNQSIYRRMYPYVEGTAQQVLSLRKLGRLIYSLPPFGEQKKIAEILTTQDKVIELEQQKIEEIKKVKKFFLSKMFPKKGQAVPEIRFKGFTDAWEQRKLGDVVKEVTRNDPTSEAPIMMITANNGFIEQSERYAFNNAGESLKKYILLEKGELAYNHGASKLRPYGSCFALTTAENARIPFVYHCFSAEEQNAEFLSIELNGSDVENQLRRIVSSGARMDGLLNISFVEYASVSVLLPKIEEQNIISDYFRHLDNLITLHQRKLEEEKQKKKALMQLLLMGIVRV